MAIDLGTSSAKICCVTALGQVLWTQQQSYPVYELSAEAKEQHPEEITKAVVELIRRAIAQWGQPTTIGLSAAMHSLLAVDRTGRALSPLLIWSDHRSLDVCRKYRLSLSDMVYRHSGVPFHPMLPLCKILYWQHIHPSWLSQVYRWISMKEYVFYQFTGEWVTDYAMAGATGMFDLQRFDWNESLLKELHIAADHLPPIVAPEAVFPINDRCRLAREVQLEAGIPVVVGASDGCLAALGSGLVGTHAMSITVATSAAVRRWSAHPVWDVHQRTFCYALSPQHFIVGTAHNNAGGVLTWLRRLFGEHEASERTLNQWIEDVLSVAAGCEGLMCLPYLQGERSPVWDPRASAAWVGIREIHQARHFQRALLEGIGFTLGESVALLEEVLDRASRYILSGGITHSPAWMQLLANILGRELQVFGGLDASCAGVLQLIARYHGQNDFRMQLSDNEQRLPIIQPQAEQAVLYADLQKKFNRLYPLLKQWWNEG